MRYECVAIGAVLWSLCKADKQVLLLEARTSRGQNLYVNPPGFRVNIESGAGFIMGSFTNVINTSLSNIQQTTMQREKPIILKSELCKNMTSPIKN